MKDNRSPVIADVLYSLQWFLVALAVCVTFSERISSDPFSLCSRLITTSAAYAVVALTVRLTDIIPIRIVIPLAAVAGCTLMGQTTAERIVFCGMGIVACVCGFVIHLRTRREEMQYSDMFVFTALLALFSVVSWRTGDTFVNRWVNVISAVFLPLCVAVWYIGRLSKSLSLFSRRTDQPVGRIRSRMRGTIFTVFMLVLLVSLLLPQSNGSSIFTVIFKAATAIIVWLVWSLLSRLPTCSTSMSVPSGGYSDSAPPAADYGAGWEIYILYLGAAVLFIVFVVWSVKCVVRFIRNIISEFLSPHDRLSKTRTSGYDTVEKLERERRERPKPFSPQSNAQKVRRIYKKRIASILGDSVGNIAALTPDEIAEKCREKNEDISALTALYKKARYTKSCSAQDVESARRA